MRLVNASTANVTSSTAERSRSVRDSTAFVQVGITGAGTDTPTVTINGRMADDMPWVQLGQTTTSAILEVSNTRYKQAVVTGQAASPKTVNVEV